MSIRLYEVHPALSHFPVALLPTAIGADVVARLSDDHRLRDFAQIATPCAAGSALLSTVSGLISQEQVKFHGESYEMLHRHRNVNFAITAASTAMAAYRVTNNRPGWGYLMGGIGVVAAVTYTGYLGSKMVYDEGVGVERADGIRLERSPEIRPNNLGEVVRAVGRDLKNGLRNSVRALFRNLEFAPSKSDLQRSIDAANPSRDIGPVPSGP